MSQVEITIDDDEFEEVVERWPMLLDLVQRLRVRKKVIESLDFAQLISLRSLEVFGIVDNDEDWDSKTMEDLERRIHARLQSGHPLEIVLVAFVKCDMFLDGDWLVGKLAQVYSWHGQGRLQLLTSDWSVPFEDELIRRNR